MLEFYEFNTLNISIVLISTFIIYYILSNYFNFSNKTEENKIGNKTGNNSGKSEFSFEYLIISVIISIGISLIVSYVMSSKDESVLTDNFWDPIVNETPDLN